MTGMLPIWGKDFNRSLVFNRDGIRWKAEIQDDIGFFPANNIVFAPSLYSSLAEGVGVPAETTGFPEFTLAYLTNSEKEVDSTLKRPKAPVPESKNPARKHSGAPMEDISLTSCFCHLQVCEYGQENPHDKPGCPGL
ncbi:MAG TPA: hypothetical protein VMW63_10620 [Methanoregulaceae archaeon]|nr:hypothetical protein [Methanoregulaceae archaeon]